MVNSINFNNFDDLDKIIKKLHHDDPVKNIGVNKEIQELYDPTKEVQFIRDYIKDNVDTSLPFFIEVDSLLSKVIDDLKNDKIEGAQDKLLAINVIIRNLANEWQKKSFELLIRNMLSKLFLVTLKNKIKILKKTNNITEKTVSLLQIADDLLNKALVETDITVRTIRSSRIHSAILILKEISPEDKKVLGDPLDSVIDLLTIEFDLGNQRLSQSKKSVRKAVRLLKTHDLL